MEEEKKLETEIGLDIEDTEQNTLASFVKSKFNYPTFSYQVSGEYLMLVKSIEEGHMYREETIIETLSCFKRAGADAILTYFALEAAKILKKG